MWLFLLLPIFFNYSFPHAITYTLNGGRLGDNIHTYCKTKWYSYKYKIQLLYKPFTLSDSFIMHTKETHFKSEKGFDEIVQVNEPEDIEKRLKKKNNILFVNNFYTEAPSLYEWAQKHPDFDREIKEMLLPIKPISPLKKPVNRITVALHVRKGGGFDNELGSLQQYSGTR